MSNYQILWKKSAIKELQLIPKEIANNIINIVDSLKENPTPVGSVKLIGTKYNYRIRI